LQETLENMVGDGLEIERTRIRRHGPWRVQHCA